MSPAALQDRADRLASLVDEFAAALRSTGVPDDSASRLLETASTAVLDALTLELLFQDAPPPAADAPAEQPPATPALPLAA